MEPIFELYNPIFDFLARLEEPIKCNELIYEVRWPAGFVCPRCSNRDFYKLKHGLLFQCKNKVCRYQCSLTSGTVFHGTKVPMNKWFMALYYMCNTQGGISAEALRKLIFVSYKTARKMLMKLRRVMLDANQKSFLSALFYKIKYLIAPKGIPTAKAAVLVMEEANAVRKVTFLSPEGFPETTQTSEQEEDPSIKTLVASAISHIRRFFIGTYHRYCQKNFPLYVAEFVYKFNEPNPQRMIRKLLADCLCVPFNESDGEIKTW